ncbi:zinc ribbon domain-containing protein [Bacillus sp. WMMC1349]|uniref:zinc ribbon domain-containing protein n=1 Tax=Bacillus sp. WMMC1349 TaxID=2736254 RepID=UPI001557F40B|nr:zinc ribbon domain-containing protein [Bacillus sp. WMMC1349]NPC94202.1 zinc ribbon domain-containing protein [Bacillus sp. WMMC1349]
MTCSKCGHQTGGGKFCENCGTSLLEAGDSSNSSMENKQAGDSSNSSMENKQAGDSSNSSMENKQAGDSSNSSMENKQTEVQKHLKTTQKALSAYFSFFMRVLKRPYEEFKHAGEQQVLYSLITMALFVLVIPLIFYFALTARFSELVEFTNVVTPSFFDIMMRSAITIAIYIFLIFIFTYAGLRIQKIQASFKAVLGRFGTLVIPFLPPLLIALIASMAKSDLFDIFLYFSVGAIAFVIPPAVLYIYREKVKGAVDFIYAILIVYLLSFISYEVFDYVIRKYIVNIVTSAIDSLY